MSLDEDIEKFIERKKKEAKPLFKKKEVRDSFDSNFFSEKKDLSKKYSEYLTTGLAFCLEEDLEESSKKLNNTINRLENELTKEDFKWVEKEREKFMEYFYEIKIK